MRSSFRPTPLDIILGTLIVVISLFIPSAGLAFGLSNPIIASVFAFVPLIGLVVGGWYTAYRSDGGGKAGALAGLIPGLFVFAFFGYSTLTETVGPTLTTAMDVDPTNQILPPAILYLGIGLALSVYVIGLAALGGFIAYYFPTKIVLRRLKRILS